MFKKSVLVLGMVLFFLGPHLHSARAQSLFDQLTVPDTAVGLALWKAYGLFKFDAASSDASDEVKGYTDVLPREVDGEGIAFGWSYGSWGINVSADIVSEKINKFADINQTSEDSTDDVYVKRASRDNRSFTVLYQPLRFFALGFGQERGTMEFKQISASGVVETNRISYRRNIMNLGLAFGFDPNDVTVGPVIAAFYKIPSPIILPFPGDSSDFSGTTRGYGFGIYGSF